MSATAEKKSVQEIVNNFDFTNYASISQFGAAAIEQSEKIIDELIDLYSATEFVMPEMLDRNPRNIYGALHTVNEAETRFGNRQSFNTTALLSVIDDTDKKINDSLRILRGERKKIHDILDRIEQLTEEEIVPARRDLNLHIEAGLHIQSKIPAELQGSAPVQALHGRFKILGRAKENFGLSVDLLADARNHYLKLYADITERITDTPIQWRSLHDRAENILSGSENEIVYGLMEKLDHTSAANVQKFGAPALRELRRLDDKIYKLYDRIFQPAADTEEKTRADIEILNKLGVAFQAASYDLHLHIEAAEIVMNDAMGTEYTELPIFDAIRAHADFLESEWHFFGSTKTMLESLHTTYTSRLKQAGEKPVSAKAPANTHSP